MKIKESNLVMKIWLDDKRKAPTGWVRTYKPEEVIEELRDDSIEVEMISLDHDLGYENKTGYDVLKWLEEKVCREDFDPPEMKVHSANVSARVKMKGAIQSIQKNS